MAKVKVKFIRKHGAHKVGDVLNVFDTQAQFLIDNYIAEYEKPTTKKRVKLKEL